MSKRLVIKLALAVMMVGTAMLLQGCGEDDDIAWSFVWAPTAGTPNGGATIFVSSW